MHEGEKRELRTCVGKYLEGRTMKNKLDRVTCEDRVMMNKNTL